MPRRGRDVGGDPQRRKERLALVLKHFDRVVSLCERHVRVALAAHCQERRHARRSSAVRRKELRHGVASGAVPRDPRSLSTTTLLVTRTPPIVERGTMSTHLNLALGMAARGLAALGLGLAAAPASASSQSAGALLALQFCESPVPPSQAFVINSNSVTNGGLCVTYGGSTSAALTLQACGQPLPPSQAWTFDSATGAFSGSPAGTPVWWNTQGGNGIEGPGSIVSVWPSSGSPGFNGVCCQPVSETLGRIVSLFSQRSSRRAFRSRARSARRRRRRATRPSRTSASTPPSRRRRSPRRFRTLRLTKCSGRARAR